MERADAALSLLPPELGFCVIVPHFLSTDECSQLIERAEATGFRAAASDYPPSYRDNDRQVIDDPELSAAWFGRLRAHAPSSLVARAASGDVECWQLDGLNERLRFCRYRSGQQFQLHQDGVHHVDARRQSRLTFMIYLTDGAAFEGGDTLFYARGPIAIGAPEVIARVRPRAGMLIMFDHALWHAGEPVRSGVKHIVRSDLIYRSQAHDAPTACRPFEGHRGYVWTLAKLPQGLASGGRDRAIRLWSEQGAATGVLVGHTQSVLGLARCGATTLASVSRDRTLKLWDLATQRCLHSVVAHRAAALSVVALSDGAIASGGADHTIQLWDASARSLGSLSGHDGWVWALDALNASRTLASASEDGTVRLWDLERRVCRATLPGKVPLRTLAVSPDQTVLVSGDQQGRLHVWTDLTTAPRLTKSFTAHDAAVRCVRFLDADTLVSAGEDSQVCTWRIADQTLLSRARHDNFATAVLKLDAQRFVSCAYDGKILAHRPQRPGSGWRGFGTARGEEDCQAGDGRLRG